MHMAQDKPTSIRILQNHKKKTLPPTVLVLGGFLAGILVSIFVFMMFIKSSNIHENTNLSIDVTSAADDHTEITQQTINAEHTADHSHSKQEHASALHESDDDETIQQPKDSDLSKLFQHAPAAARVSPFEVTKAPAPTQKPIPTIKATSQPITIESKKKAVQMDKKMVAPAEKIEIPHASVEIEVTRKPFEVQ
ncbi:hypothetical protein KTH71_04625 [Acinetobacter sp. WU_MDCI_Axc73]|nr:hypothetical protein [Acinetobacter sp. WU_MDCI_Axc73]